MMYRSPAVAQRSVSRVGVLFGLVVPGHGGRVGVNDANLVGHVGGNRDKVSRGRPTVH